MLISVNYFKIIFVFMNNSSLICVMEEIGLVIKKVRKAKKYSQEKLAELAGCSKRHIIDIESGKKSPTLKLLEKICNTLEIKEIKF